MNNKVARFSFTSMLVLVLALSVTSIALAFDSGGNPGTIGPNEITWTGQGVNSVSGQLDTEICPSNDIVPAGIDPNSYLHWILTTDGGAAEPDAILYLGGTGSGVYPTTKDSGGAFHFFTPYFTPDSNLTAYATFDVLAPGNGAWNLTISHGCAGQGPQDLEVSKTAETSFTRTFDWTIEKTADKTTVYSAGGGESEPVNFTVKVTKDDGTDSDWVVSGKITVHNPNNFDVLGVNITDTTPGGECEVINGTDLTVPAGGDAYPDYVCTFTSRPEYDVTMTNTVTATWPDIGSPNTSKSYDKEYSFGDWYIMVNDEIDVTDTNGKSWHFTDSGSVTYQMTYNDPAGTCTPHENTATIVQTGKSATVLVSDCQGADLTVSKTAVPTFTRTYAWGITKDVAAPKLVKQVGGTATFNYTVTVWGTGFTDSDWAISGDIIVTNPNDWEDIEFGLTDNHCVLTTVMREVPRNSSVIIPYSCELPSGDPGTNIATATWDKDAYHTPNGSAQGSADYEFVTPTTEVNNPVTVTDTFNGVETTLGTVAYPGPGVFEYTQTVAVPTWNCKTYYNTAKIVETGQSDTEKVKVCGPVKTGALTMGFWQNKNGQGIIKGEALTGVCPSATWLRQFAPFQDLNATATCTQVATYTTNVIKAADASGASMNPMLKAQMLATALDVYFSDPTLGGNMIKASKPIGGVKIDLIKVCKDMTCATYESVSSAFGGATKMTVMQMLTYAASQSNVGGSLWYGNIKAVQELAKDAFDAINNQKVFAGW